jgi:hypothetical protein
MDIIDKVKDIFAPANSDSTKPEAGQVTERQLLDQVKEYFKEAEEALKNRREKWKDQYRYYCNTKLETDRPKHKSNTRVNYCFVVPQIKLPVMTQSKPTVNFVSFEQSDEATQRADNLSRLVGNALWNKLRMARVISDTTLNSSIYDGGFYKIGWDVQADGGIGEVFCSSIDPFKVLPDPMAKSMEDMRFICHVEPYALSTLKRKYPDKKEKFKEDKKISEILFEGRTVSDRTAKSDFVTDNTEFKVKRAYVKEYWLAPSECDLSIMETVGSEQQQSEAPSIDPMTGQPIMQMVDVEIKAPKYRYGRVITTINDEVIIDDKPNPYTHGKFPFVFQPMNLMPNDFWGMGDLEQIIPLQNQLNHTWQLLDDIATQTANVGWTVHPDIGEVGIKKIVSALGKPGNVKIADPQLIRADVPPQPPAYLIRIITDTVQQIGNVSGITEILQGRDPKHRTAKGIERIFEAAVTRIGSSTRLMEASIRDVALLTASVAQQFYTEERTFALIGSSKSDLSRMVIQPGDLDGEYEVSIDSGASLPKDKQSRAELGFSLLQNKVFDLALSDDPKAKLIGKTILDLVEFPGREALLNQPPAPPPMMPPQMAQGQSGQPMPPDAAAAIEEMAQQLGAGNPQELMAKLGMGQ